MAEGSARVVCFDLGGVLVRLCQTWEEACVRAALPAPKAEHLARLGRHEPRRHVGARYQSGQIECAGYFAELAALSEGLFSAAEFEQLHHAWTLEHYPGALELVRALNALPGLVTACLSNTNHSHWVRLVGADGNQEYPAVVELRLQLASHLLGCAKPDARIYQLAYAQFSEAADPAASPLRPSDVIFFDDLPDNVRAARDAGWTAFQVDPSGDTVAQMRGLLAGVGVSP